MIVITSPRFGAHATPPGHPERIERAEVFDRVAAGWAARGGRTADPREALPEELARAHDARHLDEMAATAGRAVMIDPDTFTSPESHRVALLAAGAAVVAVDHALDGGGTAFALVRPPGHHAERKRAMGFCLFNNAAVAAAHAIVRGLSRVAIVDIDVHHGNGTQEIFYDDPRVLYISTHQFPYYPGTGAAHEVGRGAGAGFTVNVPLEAGAGDADYALVHRVIVGPVLEQFEPELVIVSAGFDAHERDPLASMRLSTAGYTAVVESLQRCARAGGLVLVTEGGYNLEALGECLEASLAVLREPLRAAGPSHLSGPTPRGSRAVAAVSKAQAPYWRGL